MAQISPPTLNKAILAICVITVIALVLIVIGSYRAISTMAPSEATFIVVSISLPLSIAIITVGISFLLFYYSNQDLIRSEAALLKTGCSHIDQLSKGIKESLDATLKAIEATHSSIKEELEKKQS